MLDMDATTRCEISTCIEVQLTYNHKHFKQEAGRIISRWLDSFCVGQRFEAEPWYGVSLLSVGVLGWLGTART